MLPASLRHLESADLLKATGPVFDAFSYHFYDGVLTRCTTGLGGAAGTSPDNALTDDWLARTDVVEAFYASLRDRYDPGKKLWLTETAQTAPTRRLSTP